MIDIYQSRRKYPYRCTYWKRDTSGVMILAKNEKAQDFLIYLVTEGHKLAGDAFLRRHDPDGPKYLENWQNSASSKLQEYLGRKPTPQEVHGIMELGKILFVCDGAAYSRYAITRDKDTGRYYRNANDRFTRTFIKPDDLAQRKIDIENLF